MAVGSSCGDVTADQSRECVVHAGVPAMQPGMQPGMPPAKRPRTEGYCISPAQASEMLKSGPGFLKMLVTNATAGILIGKGGLALKELEGATGCNIKLSPAKHFYPGSAHRVVCVAGKEEAVESVLSSVVECTLEAERHTALKEQREADDRLMIQMALPFTACGLVIGKGGVVQKEIAQKTGITVKITPKDQNVVPNERIASLYGPSRDALQAAAEVFRLSLGDETLGTFLETPTDMSRVAQAEAQWNRPPPANDWISPAPMAATPTFVAAPKGKGAFKGAPQVPDAGRSCQILFEVSDLEAAHIIGKGGTFLQTVCHETGAKVILSKRGEQGLGAANRSVTITGPAHSAHQAHIRVLGRAAEVIQHGPGPGPLA